MTLSPSANPWRRAAIPALLVLSAGPILAQGFPGEVLWERKISANDGGFGGTLNAGDLFGDGMTAIGDLDDDGIVDLAVGAPAEGTIRTGTVWILFMNRDGTVKSEVVIPSGMVFGSQLDPGDAFGESITCLGDLDGDGNAEIAVGAKGDDETAADAGAVWILFLDSAGAVKASPSPKKIGGALAPAPGGLLTNDHFGEAVEAIGDLDGDGVPELAVGAIDVDGGGVDRGAVFLFFLDSTGNVKGSAAPRRLDDSSPVFGGTLSNVDLLGVGIADLGDLDAGGSAVGAMAVGVKGSDIAGAGTGSVWILFLNADGSIHGPGVRIDGTVLNSDFGTDVEPLGDVNGDGVMDLAVGAWLDDNGASNAGAVWILHLSQTGLVLGMQKLSDTQGHFEGGLTQDDNFGEGLACLGDLDGDGQVELAVGARGDDVGLINSGSAFVLFLSDGTIDLSGNTTTWTGASNSDWSKNQNWTNASPGSTDTAIIPPSPNQPTAGSELIGGLWIAPSAQVTATATLEVRQGPVVVRGALAGTGSLALTGQGGPNDLILSGRGDLLETGIISLSGGVTANSNNHLVVQDGPLLITGAFRATGDVTFEVDALLVCEGPVVLNGGSGRSVAGAGTLRARDSLTLSVASASHPRIEIGGNLTVNNTAFQPSSGTVVFDGDGTTQIVQRLSASGSDVLWLNNVEVCGGANVLVEDLVAPFDPQSLEVRGNLLVEGSGGSHPTLDIENALTVFGNASGSDSSANIVTGTGSEVRGPVVVYGGIWGGTDVLITANGDVDVGLGHVLGDLFIDVTGTCRAVNAGWVIDGSMTLLDGTFTTLGDFDLTVGPLDIQSGTTFDVGGHRLSLLGSPGSVTVAGALDVGAGGALLLGPRAVGVTGALALAGSSTVPARLASTAALGGGYALDLVGGTLDAEHFVLSDMGLVVGGLAGIRIDAATGVTLQNGTIGRVHHADSLSGLLDIARPALAIYDGLRFEGLGLAAFNVKNSSVGVDVGITGWSGSFGGPDFDFAGSEPIWGADVVFFSAREHATQNELLWRVVGDGQVAAYRLERADYPSGSFAPIGPPTIASGLRDYSFLDTTIAPGQRYRYHLTEQLQGSASFDVLAALTTRGSPRPGSRPGLDMPPTFPFSSAGPSGPGHPLPDPLAPGGGPVLALEPGSYGSFTVRGRGLSLFPAGEGPIRIDASREPVRIIGLPRGETVELTGLVLDAGDAQGPAVVVEDCEGAVILSEIEVRAGRQEGIRVVNSAHVVLQHPLVRGAPQLVLVDARAFLLAGDLADVQCRGTSAFLRAGNEGRAPALRLALDAPGAPYAHVEVPGGERWWLFASAQVDVPASIGPVPFLLGRRARCVARGDGTQDVTLPAPAPGERLHYQVLALDSLRATWRVSPLLAGGR